MQVNIGYYIVTVIEYYILLFMYTTTTCTSLHKWIQFDWCMFSKIDGILYDISWTVKASYKLIFGLVLALENNYTANKVFKEKA